MPQPAAPQPPGHPRPFPRPSTGPPSATRKYHNRLCFVAGARVRKCGATRVNRPFVHEYSECVQALFIQHDHLSPPALVGEALEGLGYEINEFLVVPEEKFHSPNVQVELPDYRDYDLLVPMGAPWSVYDTAKIGNWVFDELAYLRGAMSQGVAVLGICFGGQLLAKANGGEVVRSPAPEIGWHVIHSDQPDAIPAGPWFQWHYDRVVPPPGANVVARNAAAVQAFRIGGSLGLQFHPEIDPPSLLGWLDNGGREEALEAGLDPDVMLLHTEAELPSARPRTWRLIESFHREVVLPGRASRART